MPDSGRVLVRTPIVNDKLVESDEVFTLIATPALASAAIGTGTIIDDDKPEIIVDSGITFDDFDLAAGWLNDEVWQVDGKLVPMEVKVGDKILYGKYSGTEIKINDEEYLIMKEEDILAIVK